MSPWEEQPTEDPTMPGSGMRCGDHAKHERELEDHSKQIDVLFSNVGERITNGMFKWIIGLLILCIFGLLAFQGVIIDKISGVVTSNAVIQRDLTHIQELIKEIRE